MTWFPPESGAGPGDGGPVAGPGVVHPEPFTCMMYDAGEWLAFAFRRRPLNAL